MNMTFGSYTGRSKFVNKDLSQVKHSQDSEINLSHSKKISMEDLKNLKQTYYDTKYLLNHSEVRNPEQKFDQKISKNRGYRGSTESLKRIPKEYL